VPRVERSNLPTGKTRPSACTRLTPPTPNTTIRSPSCRGPTRKSSAAEVRFGALRCSTRRPGVRPDAVSHTALGASPCRRSVAGCNEPRMALPCAGFGVWLERHLDARRTPVQGTIRASLLTGLRGPGRTWTRENRHGNGGHCALRVAPHKSPRNELADVAQPGMVYSFGCRAPARIELADLASGTVTSRSLDSQGRDVTNSDWHRDAALHRASPAYS